MRPAYVVDLALSGVSSRGRHHDTTPRPLRGSGAPDPQQGAPRPGYQRWHTA